jgi:CDP-diglyceride synthetase
MEAISFNMTFLKATWYLAFSPRLTMRYLQAYFAGMAFGRKLFASQFLQLSPNKTWEGFLGGGFFTVVYAVLAVHVWGASNFIRCGFHELQKQVTLSWCVVLVPSLYKYSQCTSPLRLINVVNSPDCSSGHMGCFRYDGD